MKWSNWKSRGLRRSNRWPHGRLYRPALEQLEDRQLLSFTPTSVLTYHNDLARTGQNLTETTLTPGNVTAGSFGKLFSYQVDGQVYAQPLYVPGVTLGNGSTHDVVYVATEHDGLYALDANGGGVLWQNSYIDPAHGIDTVKNTDVNCGQIAPELGITGTPVIDPDSGIMYFVVQFKVTTPPAVTYHQQLHAVDITTGADVLDPVEIQASVPGTGDGGSTVDFRPKAYKERAGLVLSNGIVYTSWASHCDITPSHGWVIGYDASSLNQTSVFNTSPNGQLNTIWQGNGSLAVDPNGNLYFETGNGSAGPDRGNYDEAFVNLSTANNQLGVADYFIPSNFADLDRADRDIGSGAPIVLPDQPGDHPHLLVGGGKDGRIFLMDRDNMGGLNNPPDGPDLVVQTVPNALSGGSWDTPAYFDAGDPNGPFIYYVGNGDFAKAFQLTNGLLTTSPTSQSATRFSGSFGATPIISANGTENGILWAIENRSGNLTLHAYDATDLTNELYNSNQMDGDRLGAGVKFNSPIVADGKVFVPTSNSIEIFGLLGGSPHSGHSSYHFTHGVRAAHSPALILTPAVVDPLRNASGQGRVQNPEIPAAPLLGNGPTGADLFRLVSINNSSVTGAAALTIQSPPVQDAARGVEDATVLDQTFALELPGNTL